MHLVDVLAAGVQGAANGTATINKRGTSTGATVYTDFEGLAQLGSNAVTLDANGGATVYVSELVTVAVADSSGVTVRTFDAGHGAPNVEVRSPSFTGTSYDDGSGNTTTKSSLPVDLEDVLDRWLTINGSIDWKILFNGTATSIQSALAGLAGVFFNVKDPTYGAKGDGATDDGAAIQAAIDAAQAAGGGIAFFPAGTYRTTVTIQWQDGVHLWGTGPGNSILQQATVGLDVVDVLAALGVKNTIDRMVGLELNASVATTGKVIDATAATNREFEVVNCVIGNANTTGTLIDHAGGSMRLRDVAIVMSAASQTALSSAGRAELYGGSVTPHTAPNSSSWIVVDDGIVSGVVFNSGMATSGTAFCVAPTGDTLVEGCLFRASGGATVYPVYISTSIAPGEIAVEAGNVFEGAGIKYLIAAGAGDRCQLFSRERDYAELESNANPVTIDALNFGIVWLKRTSSTNFAMDFPSPVPRGARCRVIVENASAGTINTISGGTNAKTQRGGSELIPSLEAGDVQVIDFVGGSTVGGTEAWYLANYSRTDA